MGLIWGELHAGSKVSIVSMETSRSSRDEDEVLGWMDAEGRRMLGLSLGKGTSRDGGQRYNLAF